MKQRISNRRLAVWGCVLGLILLAACATTTPPKTAEVVDEALPATTEIRDEWAAGGEDSGRVDDVWIATLGDPMLDELDVYLTAADVASAEEAVEQATAARESIMRSLEVLLGRYPSTEIKTANEQLPVPPEISVGVPADLIERRPDLKAAEARVRAAFHLTEEARLAKLPSFNLSAAGGFTSLTDFIGNLAAGIVAPLYTGGALEGQLEVATADQMAAVAADGMAVLGAFEEVETAMANERIFRKRQELLEKAVFNNENAFELAKAQYDVGRVEVLDVLQIQARVLAAKSALIRIQNERLAQRINLHLALGGSFEVNES